MKIQEAIGLAVSGRDLEFELAKDVMREMMEGSATNAQMGALLTAMRIKGETVEEITACADAMREKAKKVHREFDVMDIVGTGGDGTGTFNISTTAAFVAAAGGVKIAKHGNRSMSSKSGAADVLENLGVNISLAPEQCEKLVRDIGICFMFAQEYHASMKYAAPVRREIGIRNIFNLLGPLANPAEANLQIMGVYAECLAEPLAKVLVNLGVKRGMTVFGMDGMDEATVTSNTRVCEINNGAITSYYLEPGDLGFTKRRMQEVLGGDGAENARITQAVLSGRERGAKRDIVALNAGLCLYIAGKSKTIAGGVAAAEQLIDDGAALDKMRQLVRCSNEV
jgi:anthranilate phosphoribosyltransferase